MKQKLVYLTFALALAIGVGAYFVPPQYWQPLLINLATTFFAVGVGIIVVNIYIDKESRKGAVVSLLQLSHRAISDYHDQFVDLVLKRFGRDEWESIVNGYIKGEGDVMTIKPDHRKWIYDLAKENQNKLGPCIQDLDDALQEIISLVGWNLDDDLLALGLRGRNAIRLYRGIPYDDTDEAKAKISEYLLDMDLQSMFVRDRLIELSEIEKA